jgi:catechol 2,3-dioxygenase-like lactoylglutathione lyase family enzyme
MRQMSLVGVSGFGGGANEVQTLEATEPLQAENPLEGLRPIADGVLKTAPQLALAQADVVGEPVDPLAGIVQPERGRPHRAVGRPAQREVCRERGQPRQRRVRIEASVQSVARVEAEVGQRHAQVADLRQWHAIHGTSGARPKPHAKDDVPLPGRRDHRGGVRSGDECAPAGPPDDVGAPVWEHPNRAAIPAPRPEASNRLTQGGRRSPLAIGVRFVQDPVGVHRLDTRMDIVFVASVAVIAPDPAQSRKLYVDALGLPLAAAEGSDYWHTERLAGAKHFGIWPLGEAAQACFGQDEWPADRPVPQASIEFEVADAASVQVAAEELEQRGFELLHRAREEPWGQTVARLLSDEGVVIGISYAASLHA